MGLSIFEIGDAKVYTGKLVEADLTADGVQYSTAGETGEMHKADDTSNAVSSPDGDGTSGTLVTLVNEIKGDYNTHIASVTYHDAADTTNEVTTINANDLASAITLVNEIKGDYNAHLTQTGVHVNDDGLNVVGASDANNQATADTLADEIKADYNLHLLATVQGTLTTAFNKVVTPKISGDVLWLEVGLTMELYSDVDNTTGDFKWQGRNKEGSWTDLFALTEDADIDTAVQSYTYSGLVNNSVISKVPFELKLLIQSDTVGATVLAKVKNSSYVKVIYDAN